MCFAPQRRAISHLSSGQLAPHPPLQRAYFSTFRSPKSLEKHSVSRLCDLFKASASSFFLLFFLLLFFLLIFLFSLPLPCSAFHLSILSEVWLLNYLRWLLDTVRLFCGGFLKLGVPPNHPCIDWCSIKKQSILGYTHLWKRPYVSVGCDSESGDSIV